MPGKVCDSCKSSGATLFCRADSAFLCPSCDTLIHSANKLASRHPRVWVCDVCEQSPACVTCKADAAHLCSSCDLDIHSANPLSRRHDRVPLAPFFSSSSSNHASSNDASSNAPHADADASSNAPHADAPHDATHAHAPSHDAPHAPSHAASAAATSAAISKLFGDDYYSDSEDPEAASWLLTTTKTADEDPKSIDYLFGDSPFLDLSDPPKPDPTVDCLVPDPKPHPHPHPHPDPSPHSMYSLSSFNHNFDNPPRPPPPFPLSSFPTTQPSLSHSVSSSSLDFGVVPDANAMADVGSTPAMEKQHLKMIGFDREARVLRYREKRKNRKFEKTIRYASRKAYAETRPRIKGRFAKRTHVDPAASVDALFASDPGYGVVPSF
ncbi:hypothetical protein vseg_014090 [Gypsophila vaccaria]